MFTWAEWVLRVTNGDSLRSIAAKTGASRTSLGHWNRSGQPPADAVVAIGRAYGADIIVGFVCAGILAESDVTSGVEERLRHVPTTFLVAELSRRANAEGKDFADTLPPGWDGTA